MKNNLRLSDCICTKVNTKPTTSPSPCSSPCVTKYFGLSKIRQIIFLTKLNETLSLLQCQWCAAWITNWTRFNPSLLGRRPDCIDCSVTTSKTKHLYFSKNLFYVKVNSMYIYYTVSALKNIFTGGFFTLASLDLKVGSYCSVLLLFNRKRWHK